MRIVSAEHKKTITIGIASNIGRRSAELRAKKGSSQKKINKTVVAKADNTIKAVNDP
jgi:hypothetical protein